jgi:hypothetical protein
MISAESVEFLPDGRRPIPRHLGEKVVRQRRLSVVGVDEDGELVGAG